MASTLHIHTYFIHSQELYIAKTLTAASPKTNKELTGTSGPMLPPCAKCIRLSGKHRTLRTNGFM